MQSGNLSLSSSTRINHRFSFYRDKTGQATLKDHGFMIDWAKRAGKLVFQEAEDLKEEKFSLMNMS